jgi:plastocyanin
VIVSRVRLLAGAWVVLAALISPAQLFAKADAPRAVKSGLTTPAATTSGIDTSPTVTTKAGGATTAASGSVTIKDFSFGPASITVHAGDTVTWTNQGPTSHSATADNGSFDTGVFAAGGSKSHTFSAPGTFAYHCTPHPFMTGTVRVLASSSSSGGNSGSSGSGSGSGSSSPGTSAQSESAAVASPNAGASSSQLASTGFDPLPLTVVGLLLLAAGVAISGRRPPSRGPWR